MAPSKAAAVAPFDKGDRVLCFHHEMLYEAKILECRSTDNNSSYEYRIHYKGWKNTWDDWVPQDRVREFNDENKELAAQLHSQMKALQQQAKAPKSAGKKGRPNGSDFSSARGSEERHVATQGARGAARRNRDFDLELTPTANSDTNADPGSKLESVTNVDSKAGSSKAGSDRTGKAKSDQAKSGRNGKARSDPKAESEANGKAGSSRQLAPVAAEGRRQAASAKQVDGVHPDELFATKVSKPPRNPLTMMQESAFFNRPSVHIHIPDYLKGILVDDWENVTKLQLLVPIPHPVTVTDIIQIYHDSEVSKRLPGSAEALALKDFCEGIVQYFDECLGRLLLYCFERVQYASAYFAWQGDDRERPDLVGKSAASTYGAEHLSRLIISLPDFMAETDMDQPSIDKMRSEVRKLIVLLCRDPERFFVSEYENPGQAYIDDARNC